MSSQAITYELAKSLKDAGFPQSTERSYVFHESHVDGSPLSAPIVVPSHDKSEDWDTYVSAPTLPELIEACGVKFCSVTQVGDGWWQARAGYSNGYGREETSGTTPEEAVARLWLELNKPS